MGVEIIHHKCYMSLIPQLVDHTSHDAYFKKASLNVSYRCDYSWHTATTGMGPLLDRSVAGWAGSRRLLLARDYSWPVTPA